MCGENKRRSCSFFPIMGSNPIHWLHFCFTFALISNSVTSCLSSDVNFYPVNFSASINGIVFIDFDLLYNFWYLHTALGWFLLRKVCNFHFGMFPSWSHCFTGFRTVFVFALGRFLPMLVICFDYNGNYNGKIAEKRFSAINSVRTVIPIVIEKNYQHGKETS